MPTPQQQVLAKCKEVFVRAMELYGADLSKVGISFDLKGRAGGTASARGFPRQYHVRFNNDMLMRELDEFLTNVVPHELAHTVCQMKPALGRHHDIGWYRVCRALGGSGSRTHDMDVVYGKGTTYEYTTDRGHVVRLSDRHHTMVQQGRPVRFRHNKGSVTKACAYSIVGVQGRTLATPVVKTPAVTKELPVAAFIPADLIGMPVVIAPRPTTVVVPTLLLHEALHEAHANGKMGSKAEVSRGIMRAGYRNSNTYEQIIAVMISTNGYSRQLARATYLANYQRAGVPAP